MSDAGERVNRRLVRAGGPYEAVGMRERLPLLCLGTDVRGPELVRFVVDLTDEALAFIEALGDPRFVAPTIQGALVQAFWLGWELGREEER